MDVQLIASSVLDLPSSQRVDAIVYDGTTDLRLWRPPGADRELLEQYGPELPRVLERERERKPEGLEIGEMVRLHRGKLHCDFLVWIASRGPEVDGVRAKAPGAEVLSKAVFEVLGFAAQRHVARIAFGALGEGPDELPEVDRLVIVAKSANAYYESCYASGRPAGIEEVLVCHPHSSKIRDARRALGRAVSVVHEPRPASEPTTSRQRRSPGVRKTTTGARKTGGARRTRAAAPSLTAAEVGNARATAGAYDRSLKYEPGQYFIHSKFGVGRVESVTPEGFIMVLFDSGATKRLLHNRR